MSLLAVCGMVVPAVKPAGATPPQELKALYHPQKQTLRVFIRHTSRDRDRHYIRRIAIYKNGQWIRTFAYTRQPTRYAFHYDLDVEAQPGDVLTISAYCSKGGKRETEITISDEIPDDWREGSSEPRKAVAPHKKDQEPVPTYYFDLRTGERIPAPVKSKRY